MTTEVLTRPHSAHDIVADLPNGDYKSFYQPNYPDANELIDAVQELQETNAATTVERAERLRRDLATVQVSGGTLIIDGRCAEPVDARQPIEDMVHELRTGQRIVREVLPGALHVQRGAGQNTKPRSSATESLTGKTVPSYMGDAVNDTNPAHRMPVPSRMVAAAVQARDLVAALREGEGPNYVAHEALLLPYERAFVHEAETGKQYLLSADLPWLGARTNRLDDNPQLELLAGIENVVGVKIGADSDEQHIEGLAAMLNPTRALGKLVLMMRVGADQEAMDRILHGVAESAPESVLMYDVHGSTETRDGLKIRSIEKTVTDITLLAQKCGEFGLRLHGIHVESMGDDSRLECVDTRDQKPTHPGGVDPQFNPRQMKVLLHSLRDVLLPAAT